MAVKTKKVKKAVLLKKQKPKKQSKSVVAKITGKHEILCTDCSTPCEVQGDICAIVCADCVQKMIMPPPTVKKAAPGEAKPRGWHFKAYFEHNGVVYSKGVVVTDAKEIAKLKAGAVPTKTVAKKVVAKKKARPVKKIVKKPASRSKPNARTSK